MASPPSQPPSPQDAEVEMADGNLEAVPQQQQQQQLLPLGQGPPHPLLIDVVLDNLFGYVGFEDLSTCRRVSKQWHSVSLPHWLRKAPRLHLTLDPGRQYFLTSSSNAVAAAAAKHDEKKITTMSKFIRLVDNGFHSYGPYEYAGLRQYQNFGVKGDLGSEVQHQLFALFLRNHGQRVKVLALSLRFPDEETYRAVMFSTKSPKLVKLELDFSFAQGVVINILPKLVEGGAHTRLTSLQIECEDEHLSSLPIVGWIQLLRRYPNLQTIVYGIKRTWNAGADRLLETIWGIRQFDKKLLNLKRLEIGCYLQPSLTPLFRNSLVSLQLETLRFSAEGIPQQTITDVLSCQAPTLQNLALHKHTPFEPPNFQLPRMELVTRLELVGYPFENLSYLKSFPNLKSLILTSDGIIPEQLHSILNATTAAAEHLDGLEATLLTSFRCNYNSFVYHGYEEDISPEDMRKLQGLMPHLTDLQLRLSNPCFRMVCQCWPRLQSLTVVGNEVGDWGLSGLFPGVRRGKRFPSLTELKSFTMIHLDQDHVINPERRPPIFSGGRGVTQKSFHAFLHLPKLETLEISVPRLELELNPHLLGRLKAKIKCFKVNFATRRSEERRRTGDDN